MHRSLFIRLFSALLLLAGLAPACVQPGPILVRDILYQATTSSAPAAAKAVTVGVAPLKDARGTANSVLGKRRVDEIENDLVVQGTVAELVIAALKDALSARGAVVKDAADWDLEKGPGPRTGMDLLVAGEIKAFWVDVQSRPLNVQTKATVQLRIAVADGADGNVLRTLNLSSALSREDIAFSFETVQRTLSEAMTGALDQLLADKIVQERLP